mmetsp:Transcript_68173/g.215661  ORF Transcript_68173/g.215661 Transcript_68173/m.215661 type:complete len:227 (+) Transcript_68173:882-1562(+)
MMSSTTRKPIMAICPRMPLFWITCVILRCTPPSRVLVPSTSSSSSSSMAVCASSSSLMVSPTSPMRATLLERSSRASSCFLISRACWSPSLAIYPSFSPAIALSRRVVYDDDPEAADGSGIRLAAAAANSLSSAIRADIFVTCALVAVVHFRRLATSSASTPNRSGSFSATPIALSSSSSCQLALSMPCSTSLHSLTFSAPSGSLSHFENLSTTPSTESWISSRTR